MSRHPDHWSVHQAIANCSGFQHFSEMHAVALTPRQETHFFLLVAAAEIESPDIAREFIPLPSSRISSPPEISSHGFIVFEIVAALVDIAQPPYPRPANHPHRGFRSRSHFKQCRLPPVRSDDPTMPPGGRRKDRLSISRRSPKPLLRFSASNTIRPIADPTEW